MSADKTDKEDVGGRHAVNFRYVFTVTELSEMEETCTIRVFCSRCMSTLDRFEGCLSSIRR